MFREIWDGLQVVAACHGVFCSLACAPHYFPCRAFLVGVRAFSAWHANFGVNVKGAFARKSRIEVSRVDCRVRLNPQN